MSNADIQPVITVERYRKSDGTSDFYVTVTRGDDQLTPHCFPEEHRYRAEYLAAEYRWILLGHPKPDLMEYGPEMTFEDSQVPASDLSTKEPQ